jgi:mannose-6-phosphate isomerase-like protein (cupin superfamily)
VEAGTLRRSVRGRRSRSTLHTEASKGPQTPHLRDELYIVASGTGLYRVEDTVTAVGPGDLLFAAAHAAHGFDDFSGDFAIWVIFYGPQK